MHVVSHRPYASLDGAAIVWHRAADLEPDHIEFVDGIPTTTLARTCVDLGRRLTAHQLAHIMWEAAYRRTLDLDAIRELLLTNIRCPGSAVVRRAIELHLAGCAGTRSVTEDLLLGALIRFGIIEPVVNTAGITGVGDLEPDFCWPRHRLIVEVDGSGHTRPGAAAKDAQRDELLASAGWRVIRFTAEEIWRDVAAVVADIARALSN